MSDEFKHRLISHAQVAVERAGRAQSEAATNQFLVLPFLQLLGYDPLNPDEVVPEAHASFSDKFKNRVDFSVCLNQTPVIAVEAKKVGALVDANRGELKGYFNAVPTVKLGVLTDGLIFQLYTDTGLENMMDDEPFAALNLTDIAQGQVDPHGFDALLRLRKGTFDPANVGADARRKMHVAAYVAALQANFAAPDERLVRVLMDIAHISGRRTTKTVEEHTPLVVQAIETIIDRRILERVGFAERNDLVRIPPEAPAQPEVPAPAAAAGPVPNGRSDGVVTTEAEVRVMKYVRNRLPFLIDRDEALFQKLESIRAVDYKTVFTVYYKQERKGKIFNFRESPASPHYRFELALADGVVNVATDSFADIDQPLLAAFLARVAELG